MHRTICWAMFAKYPLFHVTCGIQPRGYSAGVSLTHLIFATTYYTFYINILCIYKQTHMSYIADSGRSMMRFRRYIYIYVR